MKQIEFKTWRNDMNCDLKRLFSYAFIFCWLVILLAGTWTRLFAAPVPVDRAKTAVQNWLGREGTPLNAGIGTHVTGSKTIKDTAGRELFHVVYLSKTGTSISGYVIVSPDDSTEPIIAFSSGARLDETPGSPLYLIAARDMGRRLNAVRKSTVSDPRTAAYASRVKSKPKWETFRTPIASMNLIASGSATPSDTQTILSDMCVAPLIQSKWDQGMISTTSASSGVDCYNYYTPGPSGWMAGGTSNYVCGCVATAMAQVMRYYQWPQTGVGTSYHYIGITDTPYQVQLRGGNGVGGAYAWSSMPLDPVASNATVAQCQQIGALTYDAGLSVSMDYNNGNSGQSGAYQFNYDDWHYGDSNGNPMTATFRYSNSILSVNYSVGIGAVLMTMLNTNLDAGCPSILSIQSASDGHCVVCDGYGYNAGTLYHHLNMGWSGQNDVWYALPEVNTPGDNFTVVSECDYNIFPIGTGEIISGRITDSGGGAISGVVVSCLKNSVPVCSSTTGATGIYALAKVPSNSTFTLTAASGRFTFTSKSISTGTSSNWIGSPTFYDGTTGNVWGVNFTPSASGTGMPSFASSSSTVVLSNSGAANLGNTLCTIQSAVYSNITVSIAATGSPASYTATNLPPGLVINATTGAIGGVPSQMGTFAAEITATNGSGQGSGILTFNVGNPFIVSGAISTGTQGFPLSGVVVTSNPSIGYSATGLPGGLSISPATGLISGTPAVTGTYTVIVTASAVIPAAFSFADGIALDGSGNLYISDYDANTVREVSNGLVRTVTGNPSATGSANGAALAATFNGPDGVGLDKAGNLYITDFVNSTIRKLSTTGTVTTLVGTPGLSGNADGTGASALFHSPNKLIVDGSDNVYITDSGNNTIRKITPAGSVSTLAGAPGMTGSANGTGSAALFNWPHSMAVDGSGNLYVSDCYNSTIRKITTAGSVTTFAGSPGASGTANGTGANARFSYPEGVAVDGSGNVYVVDSGNFTIRKITSAGAVTTLAGNPTVSGTLDGTGISANFYQPDGMILDGSGNLFVCDKYCIRKVSTATGAVTTIAGMPGVGGTNDSLVATTGTLTLSLIAPTAYQSWKKGWFGATPSGAIASDLGVNNSAGLTNLLCYGLGLNPFAATASKLPTAGITGSGGNYLTLNFSRNGQGTDLTYTVQASGDLGQSGSWQTICQYSAGAWSPTTNVAESGTSPSINVQVRDVQPITSGTRRFMRLQVTH